MPISSNRLGSGATPVVPAMVAFLLAAMAYVTHSMPSAWVLSQPPLPGGPLLAAVMYTTVYPSYSGNILSLLPGGVSLLLAASLCVALPAGAGSRSRLPGGRSYHPPLLAYGW